MRRKPVKRKRSRLGARPTTSENADAPRNDLEKPAPSWGQGILGDDEKILGDQEPEIPAATPPPEETRSSRASGKPGRERRRRAPQAREERAETLALADRDRGAIDLGDEDLRELFFDMVRIRTIDERMLKLQRQGRISFYGTATGQEAAVVGSAFALKRDDWVVPALREGGVLLMRGWPLENYVAQCYGTSADVTKGRQMPSHYADRAVRVVSWSSCIGTQLPHATGMAWAAKIQGAPDVVLAYMGDGATSESDFHTALNFAGVARAPVVFFCQNNQWAISVPSRCQTASETIAIKAEAYGFPGVRVDGNDVLQVYEATREAVRRARRGGGPTLIEALTYRMGAHSTSDDPTKYRDPREVEEWEKKDPIDRYRAFLERHGLWDKDEERTFVEDIDRELHEVIRKVERQAPPPTSTLFEDVFRETPPHLQEQARELLGIFEPPSSPPPRKEDRKPRSKAGPKKSARGARRGGSRSRSPRRKEESSTLERKRDEDRDRQRSRERSSRDRPKREAGPSRTRRPREERKPAPGTEPREKPHAREERKPAPEPEPREKPHAREERKPAPKPEPREKPHARRDEPVSPDPDRVRTDPGREKKHEQREDTRSGPPKGFGEPDPLHEAKQPRPRRRRKPRGRRR